MRILKQKVFNSPKELVEFVHEQEIEGDDIVAITQDEDYTIFYFEEDK
jgi:hypothetical protein